MESGSVARRIRFYRQRRGLSQVRLATAIGRSESWLSQVERGERYIDRVSVLTRIAEVLNVPVTELTGDPPPATEPRTAEQDLVVTIRRLLSGHDFLAYLFDSDRHLDTVALPLVDEGELMELWELAHASLYGGLVSALPQVLTSAEASTRLTEGASRARAFRHVATAYQVGAAVMAKLSQTDMAWVMADRSVLAAERSDDPLLAIAGAFRLGHAFLSGGKSEQALRAAMAGADAVRPRAAEGDRASEALLGALQLVAAIGYARLGNEKEARNSLAEAQTLARNLPPNMGGYETEFGVTNVQMHAVAVAVELGHGSEGLRLAEDVAAGVLSPERQGRFLIDVARAYGQRRDTVGAVRTLIEAEAITPEQVANHWAVRELVRDLLRRERTRPNRKLRDFAARLHLI